MRRTMLALLVLSLSCMLSNASNAASEPKGSGVPGSAVAPGSVATITPGQAVPERLDPNVFHCGPITSKDPVVREQVKALYKQQWDLQQSSLARLRTISEAARDMADSEARLALSNEGVELKRTLQVRHVELGLEIARLNEDAQRVADFEKALDQMLHPEKWMPVYTADPELHAKRLREHGITK